MSILFSGDFHGNTAKELLLITKEALIRKYQQDKYDNIKYHIILGDAGFLWPGNEAREAIYYWAFSQRHFPVLSVIGNHDPVLGRKDLPEVDIGIGNKVILIKKDKPFIAYLKRGRIYQIEGHKFLVLGGALSIDKEFQQDNGTWWKNEYWSEKEKRMLFNLLKKDNNFDYVLSHTGPGHINSLFLQHYGNRSLLDYFDEVTVLNEKVESLINCKQWFCGHWHRDKYFYDRNMKRAYQYLYVKTALMSEDGIEVL